MRFPVWGARCVIANGHVSCWKKICLVFVVSPFVCAESRHFGIDRPRFPVTGLRTRPKLNGAASRPDNFHFTGPRGSKNKNQRPKSNSSTLADDAAVFIVTRSYRSHLKEQMNKIKKNDDFYSRTPRRQRVAVDISLHLVNA